MSTLTWFSTNERGWRLLIGVICVICLALFLHFRQVRLEVLELNTTASRYVVAQIDFTFPDYETTLILKQQMKQSIGAIYRIDFKSLREAHHELETKLTRTKDWHDIVPNTSFDEMDNLLDSVKALLLDVRFTDARTIKIAKDFAPSNLSFFELIPEGDKVILPKEVWTKLEDRLTQKKQALPPEAIRYVLDAFAPLSWKLFEDERLEKNLRTAVSLTVKDKITRVRAGTNIVEPGDLITSRHLTMMQAMKQAIADSRNSTAPLSIISSLLLSLIFVMISTLYFKISDPVFLRSLQQLALFVCIVLLTLLFAKVTEFVLLKSDSVFVERIRYPIVAPFATILICILISSRIALFAAAFLSIILSVSLAVDHGHFLILNLVTSIVVIIFTRNLRKRKEVFSICLKAFLSSIPVLYAFSLSENQYWSSSLFIDIGSSLSFLMLTAIVVVGLLPALETIFHVMTDMTLMEFMDPNNPLLQKLAQTVPGTYQHSLVLGNLAEACALAIGANGLFCRVATLYHDIGKIMNPQFFTENQQSSFNVHQLLTPVESAQAIIAHVSDGEMLARKHHLPKPFIDIIREHHGTTLVYFFYRKELDLHGGRVTEVDPASFRYPGPKPRTKESGIIMICDTIEAASRSLEEGGEASLMEMIDRLIAEKAEDGQFDECNLTFEELARMKRTLVKSLLLAHHIRIKYPKRQHSC